jgi:hypothetical protein
MAMQSTPKAVGAVAAEPEELVGGLGEHEPEQQEPERSRARGRDGRDSQSRSKVSCRRVSVS